MMTHKNNTTNSKTMQTLLAGEMQALALWVAERCHTGLTTEETVLVRGYLQELAERTQEMENRFGNLLRSIAGTIDERKAGRNLPEGGAS